MPVASSTRRDDSRRAVGELEHETVLTRLTAPPTSPECESHGRVGGELVASSGIATRPGRATVVTEQAADAMGGEVALAFRVDDERPLPGAAEHQRSA